MRDEEKKLRIELPHPKDPSVIVLKDSTSLESLSFLESFKQKRHKE